MKFRDLISSPLFTISTFVLAAGMLVFSTVGGARAALITSQEYEQQMKLTTIDVAITENGAVKEGAGTLNLGMGESDDPIQIGKKYDDTLAVMNLNETVDGFEPINEYVRVTVTKYWTFKEGGTNRTVDPALIELSWANEGAWIKEAPVSDGRTERTVLYYTSPIAPGESTAPFADGVTINGDVIKYVTQEGDTNITTTYDYEDLSFVIEVEVDAVQDHNYEAAMLSAWGKTLNDVQ